jgi:hypothetical protein
MFTSTDELRVPQFVDLRKAGRTFPLALNHGYAGNVKVVRIGATTPRHPRPLAPSIAYLPHIVN